MAVDLNNFDPNSVGLKENTIYGLPFDADSARLHLLPVPWEVTTSYGGGTAAGPAIILNASYQVDLFDADYPQVWKKGIYMAEPDQEIFAMNQQYREIALEIIDFMAEGGNADEDATIAARQAEVNQASSRLNTWVYEQTQSLLNKGKLVGLVGGDHSTPFGCIRAMAEHHKGIGVLQIDAHADLRNAYEGFTYSHASIMYNVLEEIPEVSQLVQVGIRDYCDEELEYIRANPDRIRTFFDHEIKRAQFQGVSWDEMTDRIIAALPEKVYISFDIDGLDPKLCQNTGTPVPGGFETEQIYYLFSKLKASGKTIVGFDLNEVSAGLSPDENGDPFDAVVGARVLYKMSNLLLA